MWNYVGQVQHRQQRVPLRGGDGGNTQPYTFTQLLEIAPHESVRRSPSCALQSDNSGAREKEEKMTDAAPVKLPDADAIYEVCASRPVAPLTQLGPSEIETRAEHSSEKWSEETGQFILLKDVAL